MITPEQEKFCQLIADGGSGWHSYKTATGKFKASKAVASASASRWTKKNEISARIDELKAQIVEEISKDFDVTKDGMLGLLAELAYDKCIAPRDRISSITAINQMQGYNAPEKVEQTNVFEDLASELLPEPELPVFTKIG